MEIINLDLLEQQAKKNLSAAAYAYITGGIDDGWTVRENLRAYEDYPLLPRRLPGIGKDEIDTQVNMLDVKLPFPIIVPPMGAHGFASAEAETATAAGTGAAKTLYVSSTASTKTLEEIAAATDQPKWFQLYFNSDLSVTRSLLQRARAAGYTAIVLTVDALGPGSPDEFIRLGSPMPPGIAAGNFDPKKGGRGDSGNQKLDLKLSDVEFVRAESKLPVVVKGIMRPQDVAGIIGAGAAAIWVSNHGGRVLDGVPASLSVLPDIVKAVGRRVPVILDGGARRGTHVFRALALGATAVAVGRPILYGLNVGGARSVKSVLEFLRDELQTVMLSAGVAKVSDINPDFLKTDKA